MIDEASLTKGQLRRLNALRKSIGPAIADKAFARQNAQRSVRRMPGSTAATRRHSGARPALTSLAPAARAGPTDAAAAPIDGRAGTADPARFEPAGPAALAGQYPAGQAPAEPDRDLAAPQGCRSLSALLRKNLRHCQADLDCPDRPTHHSFRLRQQVPVFALATGPVPRGGGCYVGAVVGL